MKQKLKIAFLMDPLENLDLKGDTTFALALEAQKRLSNLLLLPDLYYYHLKEV